MIFLLVPPKEVKITGPTEAKIGDTITLNCGTSNSNPRAEIGWFKGGLPLKQVQTSDGVSPDGGWTTSSNVTFRIDPSDGNVVVTCQGNNKGLGASNAASHTIHVIRKL